jgi:hypothetical protein
MRFLNYDNCDFVEKYVISNSILNSKEGIPNLLKINLEFVIFEEETCKFNLQKDNFEMFTFYKLSQDN